MDSLQAKYIKEQIDKNIQANNDAITEMLVSGVKETDSSDQVIAKLITNSISISSQLAVQFVLEILQQAEILEPNETSLREHFLKIVK